METLFQVDETACFPQFQENIVNFPVFSLFTLDFDVSCSASVFDFFVELVKNSVSFLFLLISLHFFSSCMSCLVSYYHLLAEKALACKILYAQGDIIRFGNLMKKWTTKEFQSRDKRIIDTCIFKARKSTYLLICIPLFLTEKELFWKILFDKKNNRRYRFPKMVGPRPGWPPAAAAPAFA